jgi:prepilin-type N-terminal cleavage/methylation domain-containing protein
MRLPLSFHSRPARRAFSLIEVIVVSGLLGIIILGLVLMFGQTQRAYKLGTTQVDVMEGGRMVSDMLSREVAQMASGNYSNGVNVSVIMQNSLANPALLQDLPGNNPNSKRTNLLSDFFLLTKVNQRWEGIGYRVLDPATGQWPAGGLGTLYRFQGESYNIWGAPGLNQIYTDYQNRTFGLLNQTNLSRIIDGVVHFRVRAFDAEGFWVDETRNFNIVADPYNAYGDPSTLFFSSNALPASVEIELGILEEKTAERARSITDDVARRNYLAQQAGKVHIFRWRVPVRNADATAYLPIP